MASDYTERENSDMMLPLQDREEIRIVLIGKTGSGKSATGNTILQRKEFKSSISASSLTTNTISSYIQIKDTNVVVIDTPGFMDTNMVESKLESEIVKCIAMSVPGPNAFLYVIAIGRYTESDISVGQSILNLFGEQIYDNIIIVLTRKDDLDDGMSIEAYVDTLTPEFRKLLQKCGNRYLSISNRSDTKEDKHKFITDLLTMINQLSTKYYTNELLEKATKASKQRLSEDPKLRMNDLRLEVQNEGHFYVTLTGMFLTGVAAAIALPIIAGSAGLGCPAVYIAASAATAASSWTPRLITKECCIL